MFFVLVLTYSKMIRGFPIVLLVLMVLTISLCFFIVCQVFVVFRMCFLTIEITVFISLIVVIVLITKTHTKSYNTLKLIEHFTNILKLANHYPSKAP